MKRRTVHITIRLSNELKGKIEAIKKSGYGELTRIVEEAISKYELPTDSTNQRPDQSFLSNKSQPR